MRIFLLIVLLPFCWGEQCDVSSNGYKITCTDIDQRELYNQLFKNENEIQTLRLSVEVLDSNYTTLEHFARPNLQIINSRQVVMSVVISELKISRSSVTHVNEFAFKELASDLSSLDLSQNNIEDVTFLKVFEKRTLDNLDLSENRIKVLDFNVVKASTLILSSNLLSGFIGNENSMLYIDVLDLRNNQLMKYNESDLDIFGHTLDLRDNPLIEVELWNFFNSYKNIIRLNSKIESLRSDSLTCNEVYLTYMPNTTLNVDKFAMSNAMIPVLNRSYVDLELVHDLQPIHLDFSSSSITDIEPSFFEKQQINTLRLDNNKIEVIKAGYFSGATINALLNISNSQVKSIEERAITRLITCKVLDLSYNLLESVENICGPKQIDLSFNNFTDIDLNGFINCSSTTYLNLSNSNIRSIKSGSFSVLTNLDTLDLSNNVIEKIPAGVFNFSSVISLHLENNGIEVIESEAFKNMDNVFYINLSNNSIQSIEEETFSSLPRISMLFLSNNKITILNSNAFLNLPVQDLRLDGNDIKYIKTKAFNSLNLLSSLNFSNMGITYLEPFCFYNLPKLRDIDLSQNKLSSLESYTFSDLHLDYLRLYENQIEEIHSYAFSNLTGLLRIVLNSNKINRLYDNAFDQVTVYSIFMENNDLSEPFKIPSSTQVTDLTITYSGTITNYFVDNFYLNTLRFHNSTIEKLSKNSFKGLYRLIELHFNDSNINEIEEGALNALYNLEYLDARNLFKHFDTIPANLFNDLKNLSVLDFSGLGISTIENGSFIGLNKLKTLILNNNNLNTIKPEIFIGIENSLETLDLSHNKITSIGKSTFDSMLNLKILNLNHNSFNTVPTLILPNLNALYLNNNIINQLTIQSVLNLPALEILHLQNNQLQQIAFNFFSSLSSLLELRLDNNIIGSLPVGVFHGIEKLERLNVSQNVNIFSNTQTEYAIRVLSNLKYLNIANTQWTRSSVDKASISNHLPKLNTLKIDGNNLACSQLFTILKSFDQKSIDYAPDYPVYGSSNIAGIGCSGNF